MKNYKILENRPELSKEQLKEGMDFNRIKFNAAVAKSALLKSLILKGLLGIVVIGSGLYIYNSLSDFTKVVKPKSTIDTVKSPNKFAVNSNNFEQAHDNETITVTKTKSLVNKSLRDSVSKKISENKSLSSQIAEKNLIKIQSNSLPDTSSKTIIAKSENKINTIEYSLSDRTEKESRSKEFKVNARCVIWKTNTYCTFPKSAKFTSGWDCGGCDFDFVNCKDLDKNLVAVLVTMNPGVQKKFTLKSQYKNIKQISDDGKVNHPVSICLANGSIFGRNFQANGFVAKPIKEMSFILFFYNAKVGDKIVIDNFMQGIIEQ